MLKREDEAYQGRHVLTAVSLSNTPRDKARPAVRSQSHGRRVSTLGRKWSAGGGMLTTGAPQRVDKWQQPRGRSHSFTRLWRLGLKQKPHERAHHVS